MKNPLKMHVKEWLSRFKFINQYYSGIATIFMLHRVCPFEKDKLPPNENMKVSPEFLEKFIVELRKEGYKFISLDDLYEILINRIKIKKQIVFTLDDGYFDNYEFAYPIFKSYNIPFTVYITASFPEEKGILWWYILEDLIIQNRKIVLSSGIEYLTDTRENKIKAFMELRNLIMSFNREVFGGLNSLFSNYKIDWFRKCQELSLNWEQIKKLSEDPLVTIGGHTLNHFVLSKLDDEEVVEEIVEGNRLIERKIDKKVEHFAYPFGGRDEVTKREYNIVKDLSMKTAVIAIAGNIYLEHKNYLRCLPRIMLTENFDIKNIGKIRRRRIVIV